MLFINHQKVKPYRTKMNSQYFCHSYALLKIRNAHENNCTTEVSSAWVGLNEQFLLFPQCFLPVWRTFRHFHQIQNCRLQNLSVWKSPKFVIWERVNRSIEGYKYLLYSSFTFTDKEISAEEVKNLEDLIDHMKTKKATFVRQEYHIKEDELCNICYANQLTTTFKPCGHRSCRYVS